MTALSRPIGFYGSRNYYKRLDGRRYCVWRILAPYLVNVRKLSDEESYSVIISWLERCNMLKRLSFDPSCLHWTGTLQLLADQRERQNRQCLKVITVILYPLLGRNCK